MIAPILRAVAQLNDPAFLGVVWRSIAASALAFAALAYGLATGLHRLVPPDWLWGWGGWLSGAAGGIGAALLALWLFIPFAVVVAALLADRVAAAVDRRFYPNLPPPTGAAPLAVQVWDGLALGLRVLVLQLAGLLLALLLPGVGLVIGWLIGGWAVGRGLFVGVAMRRMGRPDAVALFTRQRLTVVGYGVLLALASSVPLLNLLVPVLGAAMMVHILNQHLPPAMPGGLPRLEQPARPALMGRPRA